MTIEIKPAEIVGASIGDRVSYEAPLDAPSVTWYGTIAGLSTEFPGRVVVNLEAANGTCRHIEPERLSLAPKKYAVGDRVSIATDGDALPNGTVLIDSNNVWLPAFKRGGEWFIIDPHTASGEGLRKASRSVERSRSIGWLPVGYLNN